MKTYCTQKEQVVNKTLIKTASYKILFICKTDTDRPQAAGRCLGFVLAAGGKRGKMTFPLRGLSVLRVTNVHSINSVKSDRTVVEE